MVFVPFFRSRHSSGQIGGGLFLIAGYKVRLTALMFAAMTLVINIVMQARLLERLRGLEPRS